MFTQTRTDKDLATVITEHIGKHSPKVNDLLIEIQMQLAHERNDGREYRYEAMRMIETELFKTLIRILGVHGFDTFKLGTVGGRRRTDNPVYGGGHWRGRILRNALNRNRQTIWDELDAHEREFLLLKGEEWINWSSGGFADVTWWVNNAELLEPTLRLIATKLIDKIITKYPNAKRLCNQLTLNHC